jgi:hypothetical protein
MVTVIGVLNLIFALACGCLSFAWAATWTMIERDHERLAVEIPAMMRQAITIQIEKSGEDERALQAAFEEAVKPETVREALLSVGQSPALKPIRIATMVAAFAQAGLFVGSILLLMRKSSGRTLSMLALLAFIGATIATMIKFQDPAERIATEIKTKVLASDGYRGLPEEDRNKLDQALEVLPDVVQGSVGGTSVFAMAWPAVSFLILLASRKIKDACAAGRPAP